MILSVATAFGLLAATLQVVGYSLYISNFAREAIRPNAASFLMFSYGTSLLAFLEWKNAASWEVLALPLICSAMGIVVALMCLRKGATEPIDRFEATAFATDLWLTVIYAWFALGYGDASGIVTPFLIATNLTAVTCFLPIIRSTWQTPARERHSSWFVWTAAYGALGVATWLADGGRHPALLVYPLLNAALHFLVGVLALRGNHVAVPAAAKAVGITLAPSSINGLGMFASDGFAAGDVICTLEGELKRRPERSEPNWIGVGPHAWIDPAFPLDHVNHSCAPNAAFAARRQLVALRPIAPDEEVTLDYSTTEVDPNWTMACTCGETGCRRGLHAIQISFADQAAPPAASPLMQLIWRKRHVPPVETPAFPQLADPTAKTVSRGARSRAPRRVPSVRARKPASSKSAA